MLAAPMKSARPGPPARPALAIADLVLIRCAVPSGATRAELQRDLSPLLGSRPPGTAFRRAAELAIGAWTGQNFLSETKGRITVTGTGSRAAEDILGTSKVARETWENLRNGVLVALSLGLNGESPAIAKALERADGLAALTLQRHFGLPAGKALSLNDLRAELAVVALERAFGNKIKTGLSKGSGLPGKTARLLAGQLLKKPREFSSDGKLVAALAAEIAGASNETLEALRLALLRRLTLPDFGISGEAEEEENLAGAPLPAPRRKADNDAAPLEAAPPGVSRTAEPPEMREFVSSVLDAARPLSQGWPGNKKAFISRVWQAIRLARREWDLTEIAFKSMLAEAHRSGQLVLATADLKDRTALKDLEESKILYKNTIWHFVRVDDECGVPQLPL